MEVLDSGDLMKMRQHCSGNEEGERRGPAVKNLPAEEDLYLLLRFMISISSIIFIKSVSFL